MAQIVYFALRYLINLIQFNKSALNSESCMGTIYEPRICYDDTTQLSDIIIEENLMSEPLSMI